MRKASLGTILLTVFLDLLGFGLVVPYLPGVARDYGATDFQATLLGASYSLMQLIFVPIWGHLSDRIGRRPVLLGSIMASVLGMVALGTSTSLFMLFAARIFGGIATANLSVAQAYIADVTKPEERARGMGLIGVGMGLGFILGPVFGGLLEASSPLSRPGALPAYAAAGLSVLNLVLCFAYLPESLTLERRKQGTVTFASVSPVSLERFRLAFAVPGVALAVLVNFVSVMSFASLEQTLRLFTADEFSMSTKGTGYVLGFAGLVLLLVQGGVLRPLSRRTTERVLIVSGVLIQAVGFAVVAVSPLPTMMKVTILYGGMGLLAFGSGLTRPSVSAYVSRCGSEGNQGVLLGVTQSAAALGRVFGPATGGLLYDYVGTSAPYAAASGGMLLATLLAWRLTQPKGEGAAIAAA